MDELISFSLSIVVSKIIGKIFDCDVDIDLERDSIAIETCVNTQKKQNHFYQSIRNWQQSGIMKRTVT